MAQILTTTGYGDIRPRSVLETITQARITPKVSRVVYSYAVVVTA